MFINCLKDQIITHTCIIGSGIGGGTLAKKLYESGKDFAIIEAGGFKGNSDNVNYENVGRDFGVRSTTTIQIGGTSNLWHGVLAPLDKIDFEKRDWIPHSGWPIALDDLEPFYKQASDVFAVDRHDYFYTEHLPQELKKQIADLPFDRSFLYNKLFQLSLPALNFKNVITDICGKSDKYHCYHDTVALEFISEDGKISKLKVGNTDGSFSYVKAEQFIISAGALETPRLLLNSGLKNDNIGKYLMDHPMGNLCQMKFLKPAKHPIYSDTKYSPHMKIKTGLELTPEKQRELKLPNNNFYLRPSFVEGIDNKSETVKLSLLAFKDGKISFKDAWQVITNINVILWILVYKFSLNIKYKFADLFFVTEQIPNPESKVSLSDKKDKWGYPVSKVNWQVKKEDIEHMKAWFSLVLNKFFPAENYKFTHSSNDFNWENIYTSAIHHVGTARMGFTEADGVVDKNLKVFGTENLYVCDGSVFTTAGNVNNGLTISAFACRLADHLKKQ